MTPGQVPDLQDLGDRKRQKVKLEARTKRPLNDEQLNTEKYRF